MKLRHVLLLACAMGACGALLLAADTYRRLKEAEGAALLNPLSAGLTPPLLRGAGPAGRVANSTYADGAVLNFLAAHAVGFVSLAFLFLAVFLLLVAALRDRTFAAALDGVPPPAPEAPPAIEAVPVVSLAELAATEPSVEETPPVQPPEDSAAQDAAASEPRP